MVLLHHLFSVQYCEFGLWVSGRQAREVGYDVDQGRSHYFRSWEDIQSCNCPPPPSKKGEKKLNINYWPVATLNTKNVLVHICLRNSPSHISLGLQLPICCLQMPRRPTRSGSARFLFATVKNCSEHIANNRHQPAQQWVHGTRPNWTPLPASDIAAWFGAWKPLKRHMKHTRLCISC